MYTTNARISYSLILIASGLVSSADVSLRAQGPLSREQIAALRTGGLRAAARVKGTITLSPPAFPDLEPQGLEHLVKDSDVIIVGTTGNNRSWLSESGRTIYTSYDVKIVHAVKGTVKTNNEITVSVLGGRVSFEDGSIAEVKPHGAVMPTPGGRYLFFLRQTVDVSAEQEAAGKGMVLSPLLDYHGLYPIVTKGRVLSLAGEPGRRVAAELEGLDENGVIERLRALVVRGKLWSSRNTDPILINVDSDGVQSPSNLKPVSGGARGGR